MAASLCFRVVTALEDDLGTELHLTGRIGSIEASEGGNVSDC